MKDRYIAVAYKRQIGKLLMIAGPTAAGKSTLVEKLRRGELPEIINKLQLGEKKLSEWDFSAPALLENLGAQKIDHLIYHYDILLPHKHQLGDHFKDHYLNILNTANQKSILTIWVPPDRLRQQFADSEIQGRKKVKKANLRLMKEYEDPGKVIAFYREWIHFVQSLNVEHWIAEFSDGVRFYSPQEWEAMALQATD
jgi:energy-coupling factor transporter ATP-binding protein EcfA2